MASPSIGDPRWPHLHNPPPPPLPTPTSYLFSTGTAHLLLGLLACLLLLLLLLTRLLVVLPRGRGAPLPKRSARTSKEDVKVKLGIFLGSGGHTAEMRALLRTLDLGKYARVWVVGVGDEMSLRCVGEIESERSERSENERCERSENDGGSTHGHGERSGHEHNTPAYTLLALPRARAVGEGTLSTLVSASRTLAAALPCVGLRGPWVDVLVLNGPGTGVVLVLVCYLRRVSTNQKWVG
jgi:beta-1,4-N-acetylglucosaminyltransferase